MSKQKKYCEHCGGVHQEPWPGWRVWWKRQTIMQRSRTVLIITGIAVAWLFGMFG